MHYIEKRRIVSLLVVNSRTNERSIPMGRHVKFEEVLRLLEEYKEEYGHCNVPQNHKTASGIPLGVIVNSRRSGRRKVTAEEKEKLDAIGFVRKMREKIPFKEVFRLLEEYKKEYGHCNVPYEHKTASKIPLGVIVSSIRSGNRKITAEEKEKLDAIGFVWRVTGRKK